MVKNIFFMNFPILLILGIKGIINYPLIDLDLVFFFSLKNCQVCLCVYIMLTVEMSLPRFQVETFNIPWLLQKIWPYGPVQWGMEICVLPSDEASSQQGYLV